MFVGLHAMLAVKTQIPEIAISPDEGAAFMNAAQNVLRHYSVETTQKTLDWLAFAGVAGGIYGTRAASVMFRAQNAKAPGSRDRATRADPQADAFAAELLNGGGGAPHGH